MSKKVLFITEGEVDELHLVKSICKDLGLAKSERFFYCYQTDFHQFARLILPDNSLVVDDSIDLLLTLKSCEQDKKKIKVLEKRYTDIFIIFDLDPHAIHTEFEKIRVLASFFNNSSDNGRLYINYPMMQSYKHLKSLPDPDYQYREIDISQMKHYKEIVSIESEAELIKAHDYTHVQLYEIAAHNFCKREKILGREYRINSSSFYDGYEDLIILDKQLSELRKNDKCYVLNTSSLIYLEYRPNSFFNEINRHRERFRI